MIKRAFCLGTFWFLSNGGIAFAQEEVSPVPVPAAPEGSGRKDRVDGGRIRRPLMGKPVDKNGTPPPVPTATPTTPPPTPQTPAQTGAPISLAKRQGDTNGLKQFEQGVDYEPRGNGYRVSFSLEDADLGELIRVIGQLTGKRFIITGNVRANKVTVFSPQKVTVGEAYQAFLSILDTQGLAVIPSGRFYKIVEVKGTATGLNTTIYGPGRAAPAEERLITRMHRLQNISAQEAADLLKQFKSSANADVTPHAATNMLIITDTGSNIRRMLHILEEIDVGGASEQVWIETMNYGTATDVAARLNELFDIKGGAAPAAGAKPAAGAATGGGDSRISKVFPDERTNSVIIVATERAYLRALEFIKVIDVQQKGEGDVRVRPLQYAEAIKLATVLNGVSDSAAQMGGRGGGQPAGGQKPGGVFEAGVKIIADEATNSLIITSSMRDYAQIGKVIDQLDKPRRQVFIEAALMDLNVTRKDEFGIKFHGGIPDVGAPGSLIAGGLDPLGSATAFSGTGAATALQNFALGLRGPTIPGSEAIFGTAIPSVGLAINMIAASGDSDLLATPHILATDNIEAKIEVGEMLPQQTNSGFTGALSGIPGAAGALSAFGGMGSGYGGGSAPLQTGIKVSIKPFINESDEVRLQIKEEYSEPTEPEGTLGVRGARKRTAETTLTVRDQQTVVIAGLMRSRSVRGQTKVPILGDIPLLGALFRSDKKELAKSNLLLVLTPYIVRSQDDLRRVFERKIQEKEEFVQRYFVFSDNEYDPPKDYGRAYGALEMVRQSYVAVEERRALDSLLGHKAVKTHVPGRPLELPAPIRTLGGGAAAPPPTDIGAVTPTAPRVDGKPPVRNILKVEP